MSAGEEGLGLGRNRRGKFKVQKGLLEVDTTFRWRATRGGGEGHKNVDRPKPNPGGVHRGHYSAWGLSRQQVKTPRPLALCRLSQCPGAFAFPPATALTVQHTPQTARTVVRDLGSGDTRAAN